MSLAAGARDRLPTVDSPLDAVDSLFAAGAVAGVAAYGVALLTGDVAVATAGVGVGVACVLSALALRSARAAARAL
jgi:uncharacterized MnhB-related membrane protein